MAEEPRGEEHREEGLRFSYKVAAASMIVGSVGASLMNAPNTDHPPLLNTEPVIDTVAVPAISSDPGTLEKVNDFLNSANNIFDNLNKLVEKLIRLEGNVLNSAILTSAPVLFGKLIKCVWRNCICLLISSGDEHIVVEALLEYSKLLGEKHKIDIIKLRSSNSDDEEQSIICFDEEGNQDVTYENIVPKAEELISKLSFPVIQRGENEDKSNYYFITNKAEELTAEGLEITGPKPLLEPQYFLKNELSREERVLGLVMSLVVYEEDEQKLASNLISIFGKDMAKQTCTDLCKLLLKRAPELLVRDLFLDIIKKYNSSSVIQDMLDILSASTVNETLIEAAEYLNTKTVSTLMNDSRVISDTINKVLVLAARRSNTEAVLTLINDPRITSDAINKAMVEAARSTNTEIVSMLMNDPRVTSDAINKAMVGAAGSTNTETVSMLMNDPRITSDAINKAMVGAAGSTNTEIVSMLMNDPRITSDAINKAMVGAAGSTNTETVSMLMNDPRVTSDAINEALVEAARYSNTETVSMLMNDPRVTSDAINEALVEAARYSNTKAVSMLMNDPRVTSDAIYEALIEAARGSNTETVSMLMNDSRLTLDAIRKALVQAASYSRKANVFKILMNDPRVTSDAIKEALIEAVRRSNTETVSMLINDSRVTSDAIYEASKNAANSNIFGM
ncbi:hypothetical protein AKO1_013254, partial [Acrasis kona]